jgi:chromosome segregation ATPase
MENATQGKIYKSPIKKLVRFFEKSRDEWKAKHQKAKANAKRLSNRIRFLEKSKMQWKNRVKELEQEVARLKAREQDLEQAMENLEKKESMSK